MILPLIWLAVLVAVLALYFRRVYSSFNREGIKHFKPVPLLGNLGSLLLRKEHFCDHIVNLYKSFPEERFLSLIRWEIRVSEASQEWKDMRSTLSPAFTSSKMRLMLPFMVEVGNQMMQMLHQKIRESKNGTITIDCKDLTTRYANDLLKLDFLSEESKKGFKKIVLDTMQNREMKDIIRPDMIHLLMEAKKGRLTHEEDKTNDVAAGFATVQESAVGKKMTDREALRLWPPAVTLDRICTKDYNMGKPNPKSEKDFIIMMILLIWFAVLVSAILLYFRKLYSTFSHHGIKHIKPVPIFGNMAKIILRTEHLNDELSKLYNEFPEERFVGRYDFNKEVILVRDLELIKKITVKDFEHFIDHRFFLAAASPFSPGTCQEWKDMRSTLSPAFTSSKIRLMVPFMVEVGDQMMRSLHKLIRESKRSFIGGSVDIECKDLTTRYANDVIASCAFGLKIDSHNDKNNSFYALGKETSTLTFHKVLSSFVLVAAPAVGKLTHEDIKSNDVAAGFATVTESSVGKKAVNRGAFVGRYEFIKELIVVRDLELVKKITVKDFEHFLDHRPLLGNSDSYFSRNLFSLRGNFFHWSRMERHAVHVEPSFYELQDATHGAFYGGSRRSDDAVAA
ncbi:hypothetical protein HF086_012126 [Spodoptera exigua]|uniref:unspecific monooxygenase n=1 Tax=Spodoptera exigua TaxID=7107 RepID=A0A922MYF0_SPOEX|nr:hypothetical protein HF086_012126 [Spodoptera exigua]